jgi:hypothetical protein
LEDAQCNNDGTYVRLKFHNELESAKYDAEWQVGVNFLTQGKKYKCVMKNPKLNKTGAFIRRIVDSTMSGQFIEVRTTLSRYDEVYQEADIQYASNGVCDYKTAKPLHAEEGAISAQSGKNICIGFNTDCENGATNPLPLYQNTWLTITCTECYFGHSVDVFLEIKISHWTLQKLAAGYKNMETTSGMVITATAHAGWSSGIEKVLEIANDATLIDFHLGPVPFLVTFDIPVQVQANLEFDATATATFGETSTWSIGDHYVQWDPKNHWTHVTPSPKLTSETKIRDASANFNAVATLSIAPTLAMHVDNMFSYRATMTPTLIGKVTGSTVTKQVCANLSYSLAIDAETEMSIAIPVLNIHDDWVWDKSIYDSGDVPLAGKCWSNLTRSYALK